MKNKKKKDSLEKVISELPTASLELSKKDIKEMTEDIIKKKKRICKNCGRSGHISKTCGAKIEQTVRIEETVEIASEERPIPKKGLWIIQPNKRVVVGKIKKVSPTGDVNYLSVSGALVESQENSLQKGGYTYIELEPEHLKYKMGFL